jgi:hypothetical protein
VPTLLTRHARTTPLTVKLSLAISLLLGILLLVCAALKLGHSWPYVGPIAPDLWHDLGIAFLVSFAVAWLFEIYRSVHHQMESMRDVIDFVMGELITADVWLEVKELIEAKYVIRRDVRIRLELGLVAGLREHEAVLKVEHEYNMWSLRNKKRTMTVEHELDYQFKNPGLDLPRWETLVIDPPDVRVEGPIDLDAPQLRVGVYLPPRQDERPVFVRTERREIVHVPGSYNFYTPDFMKGLRLTILGCPPDVRVEVWVRPHGGGHALQDQDHTWSYEEIIFPGQGIEIKFIPKDSTPVPAASAS